MLAKLKEMFGPGPSTRGGVQRRRVNLQSRFMIVSETSRGSMSRVYRAIDNETGRTVCLKVQMREKNEAAVARASHPGGAPAGGGDRDPVGSSPRGAHVRVRRHRTRASITS